MLTLITKKAFMLVFLLAALTAPVTWATSCSAYIDCGANCSITAPTGGSVHCEEGLGEVTCTAFDANGNFHAASSDFCYNYGLVGC